jgi:hypothetical protein
MSDPADKSDDLIAELARLMAASTPSPQPAATPEPPAKAPAAPPVRIPGMAPPRPADAAAPRAPVTGSIRIPGMDAPAPVATSAPVSKFDFGKPVAAAPIRHEPLSSLTERLAPHDPVPPPARVEPNPGPTPPPTPQPTPIRVPADLKPVTENRSFAQGPALPVTPPPASPPPAAPSTSGAGDFNFDFGFGKNPPPSASPPRPTTPPAGDPIADLIAAELDDAPAAPEEKPRPAFPAVKPATGAPPPLKPVTVAPRAPETDRFAVSPDSGLDMKSAPPSAPPKAPPPDDSDPMSEIESLIGEAVRVELSAPGPVKVQTAQSRIEPQVTFDAETDADGDGEDGDAAEPAHRPEPAPVVPPLTAQFAPRRSSLKEEAAASGAEDAILAAAAASGAQLDRLDPSIGDESPYRRLKVTPARSGFFAGGTRQYVGMAVAATLLLAAGLGLYWVLNIGRNQLATGENAPQLTADATPVKEVPSVEPAAETARSPVLEQIDGTSAAPSVEQLVSTDETNGAPVVAAREVTPTAADDGDNGLANRKVRTVTVRPDGTIVSGDDAVAGAEELPVERPNVPAVPATDTPNLLSEPTSVATTEPAAIGTTPVVDVAPPAAGEAPVSNSNLVAPIPMSFPAHEPGTTRAAAASTPAASTPVVGAQTPNGQIDLLGGGTPAAPTQVATVTPADPGNAAAYVQLSSSPSEGDAQASLRAMSNRYGSLFGGNALSIQAADLGQKGTWYRVRLPAASLGEAQRICANIKANGGDCIVTGG